MLRTRVHIAETALDLFETHGFDAVTVKEIAEVAGVGERTVYRYYPTKVDIVLHDDHSEISNFVELLHAAPRHLPVTAVIRESFERLLPPLDALDRERRRLHLIRTTPTIAAAYSAALDDLEPILTAWITDRSELDDFEARVAAAALLAAQRTITATWDGETFDSFLELADRALAVVGDGLDRQA